MWRSGWNGDERHRTIWQIANDLRGSVVCLEFLLFKGDSIPMRMGRLFYKEFFIIL